MISPHMQRQVHGSLCGIALLLLGISWMADRLCRFFMYAAGVPLPFRVAHGDAAMERIGVDRTARDAWLRMHSQLDDDGRLREPIVVETARTSRTYSALARATEQAARAAHLTAQLRTTPQEPEYALSDIPF